MSYKTLVVSSDEDEKNELLEMAWGLIANAYSGDWDKATNGWKPAAMRWRDRWFKLLPNHTKDDHECDI